MNTLVIRCENTGSEWRIMPDPEPIVAGAIHETGSYLFELRGSSEAPEAELVIDDIPMEALRAPGREMARWRWSPGFHAGTIEAELRIPGAAVQRFEVVTDPDRRKLTRDDFETMVRELLGDTFALFSLSGFRTAVARGVGTRPPPIARLEFLRSRVAELETVVADIQRAPRRRLDADEVAVPYYRATRTTGLEILRSFRSGQVFKERGTPSRLPAALNGFLPAQIRTRRRLSKLDLPEHRQMGACLRSWASWLASAADLLQGAVPRGDTEARTAAALWAGRCRRLSRRVAKLGALELFVEAGDAPARLVLSAVFRNDPAYRRFYRLWQDINLGIASVFGDFLNLPLARTFDLYELWCFLRLVRAAAEEFGPAGLVIDDLFITDAAGGVTIAARAATVSIGDGWKLCFQKQYREFWREADGRGSYSRTMTPDVVAHAPTEEGGTDRLIVLDAKYRIDDGLNDALNSIHTYRDALVRSAAGGSVEGIVSAAYLLAPYVPVLGPDYRSTDLPGRLFHPEYRTGFRFGAVTLRPGMTDPEMRAALRVLLDDVAGAS